MRQQLVADGRPETVPHLGVDHPPVAASRGVDFSLGLLPAAQQGSDRPEPTPVRVLVSRQRLDVDLVDRVALSLQVEVEPEAEQVLVDGGGERGRDQRRRVRACSVGHRRHPDDARQLDLHLDRAVEVEVPEDPVLVIAERVDRADDEPARPPHLRLPRGCEHVRVLPQGCRSPPCACTPRSRPQVRQPRAARTPWSFSASAAAAGPSSSTTRR